ncbi:hypothetical protein [Actinocrispum wychmicini]|uniref:hypothetical protein n=1 Tax=Actinocrispum wychmicini TaxID=1213861 RepID=UPI0010442D61|nr:hypothetical protein [Actinocrispum wychmicini]
MGSDGSTAPRPGWHRDAAVPHELSELHGPTDGSIGLPARLFWSGPDPRSVRWDLTDPSRRRDFYEIVLVQGTLDDVRELLDGAALIQLWDVMYLPKRVRSAWQPLVDSGRTAA